MKIKNLILASLFILPSLAYSIGPITPTDHEKLMKGEMLQEVKWKEGYVWPEVSMRALVNHSPAENMEVFMDFENHKNYIPDMLESKVVKKISPDNMHVYMAMEMPWPVKKSTHTTSNVLTKGADGSYTLSWSLVKAEFLKATDGYITFKPYEGGKTLMEYVTFIVPNSSFAGMFKNKVAPDVERTVKKIAKHLDKTLSKKEAVLSDSQKAEEKKNL